VLMSLFLSRFWLFLFMSFWLFAGHAQYSSIEEVQTALANIQSSTCLLVFDGQYTCTGTLINNTSNNGRPFILSAAHCVDDPDQIQSIVVIFGRHKLLANSNLDALEWRSDFGADLRAISYENDYLLLELREELPDELMPVYMGWNSQVVQQSVVSTIHHPTFDFKQFAHTRNRSEVSSFSGIASSPSNGFWKVKSWTIGETVEGSSGAALLDDQLRIIGGLSGSSIKGADTTDIFFRFDLAAGFISEYIDPQNTGTSSILETNLESLKALSKFVGYNYLDSLSGFLPLQSEQKLIQEFDELVSGRLKGIYLAIGDIEGDLLNSLTVQIISNGENQYAEEINLFTLDQNAENYIPFLTEVDIIGSFSIEITLNTFIEDEIVFFPYVNNEGNGVLLNGFLVENGVYAEYDNSSNTVEKVIIFPNPAQDFFIINSEIEKVELITSDGILVPVSSRRDFANQSIVDVSGLSSGLYYSNIYLANGKQLHYRIVIR
ncbi:MAG: T9SS type A sorting domain-containing protein, partial [Bacteroidota bacterium]